MGVVNEAVENGIGISWVADKGVPFVHGDLAGENGRAAPIAFLGDLVEVTTGTGVERFLRSHRSMVSQIEDFTSSRASGPTAFSGAASQGRDHVIFANISVH
jgi:hypothetical protein